MCDINPRGKANVHNKIVSRALKQKKEKNLEEQ